MMGAILPEGQGERVVSNDGCYSSLGDIKFVESSVVIF